MDIEKKVFLLAILKKQKDETINDILITLEESQVFSFKQGKAYLKELKKEALILNNELSFTGLAAANEAQEEFKI